MAFERDTALPINNGASVLKAGGTLTAATNVSNLIPGLDPMQPTVADYQKLVEVNGGNALAQDGVKSSPTITMITYPLSQPTINNAYAFLNNKGQWIVRTTGAVTKPNTVDFYATASIGTEAASTSAFLVGRHVIRTAN